MTWYAQGNPGVEVAGRVDSSNQEVAIAKIAELAPFATEIREQLGLVLASAAFRGSHRSQEFLKYVVESALTNQCEQLKERSIGIALFARNASYDTGEDAIVRVTANDVRKRLVQFYSEPNPRSTFRIELPPGSYIPEFRRIASRAIPLTDSRNSAAVSPASSEPAQGTARGPLSIKALVALGALLLAIGWLAATISARHGAETSAASAGNHPEPYDFYNDLLGPIATDSQKDTKIVLSNPHLLLYLGSQASKPPYPDNFSVSVPPELEKKLNPTANDVQASFPHHYLTLSTEDYTGMGEASTAIGISRVLQALGRPVRATQARFLNWDAARKEHLILLGAPHMSAWTQRSLSQVNFIMDHDLIRNTHPLPGEQETYPNHKVGDVQEDHGLIWMARTPSGSRLLLLAGLSSTGTAGIGEFLCDPERMRPVYEKLKAAKSGSMPEQWQVLLKITGRDNVPVDVSFISLRVY